MAIVEYLDRSRPSPLRARRLLRGLRLRDVERATRIPDTTLSRLELRPALSPGERPAAVFHYDGGGRLSPRCAEDPPEQRLRPASSAKANTSFASLVSALSESE